MYRNAYKLAGIAALLLLTSACQKVIDFKVANTAPIPVIEGALYGPDSTCNIHISMTADVFDSREPDLVNNALVTVSEAQQGSDTFMSDGQGNYHPRFLHAIPGRTYHLYLKIQGREYTSVSEMFAPVNLDSLTLAPSNSIRGGGNSSRRAPGDKQYQVTTHFNDPANHPVYYRLRALVIDPLDSVKPKFNNNELDPRFNRGKKIDYPLFRGRVWTRDTVRVELETLDFGTYEYYRTLRTSQSSNSISPSNPTSNIKGGCLGYFGAISVSRKTIIIN